MNDQFEKHKQEVEAFAKAQHDFNAYTQEAMRQLEEERRITTEHKKELSNSISEQENLYSELKAKNDGLK